MKHAYITIIYYTCLWHDGNYYNTGTTPSQNESQLTSADVNKDIKSDTSITESQGLISALRGKIINYLKLIVKVHMIAMYLLYLTNFLLNFVWVDQVKRGLILVWQSDHFVMLKHIGFLNKWYLQGILNNVQIM